MKEARYGITGSHYAEYTPYRCKTCELSSGYIPLYALNKERNFPNNYLIGNIGFWGLPSHFPLTERFTKNIVDTCLSGGSRKFVQIDYKVPIVVARGVIMDKEGNILFIFTTNHKRNKDTLFMSPKLYQDDFNTLYRHLYKQYITPALKEGVEMIIVPSTVIRKRVFPPTVKSFTDGSTADSYNNFMEEVIPHILLEESEILLTMGDVVRELTFVHQKIYSCAILDEMIDEFIKGITVDKPIGEQIKDFILLNPPSDDATILPFN